MLQRYLLIIAGLIFNGCSSAENATIQQDYHVIPFGTIGHRIPVIKAILNEKNAWFIVDTGASITLLNATAAQHFGFSMHNSHGELMELTGFSDNLMLSKTSFCRIEIGHLKIGQSMYRSHEMNALFTTIEKQENIRIAGVLGSDILARYRMNVNYETRTLSYRMNRACSIDINH